jgi:hypothetical protein
MLAMLATIQKSEISPAELSQRVAVIRRFKELLQAQRDRFNEYLGALDRQKELIQTGSAEELIQHVELEEKIVSDIFSIQRVIEPLEEMYQSTRTESSLSRAGGGLAQDGLGGDEIPSLKEALDSLKAEAVIRSEQNRELLAKRMEELRSEIKSIKGGAYARRPFNNDPTPTLVDIKG